MQAVIIPILIWLTASVIARVLLGAGLAISSHSFISEYVTNFLNNLTSGLSVLGPAADLLYIAGIGPALSVIGAAVVARATFEVAKVFLVRAS